MKKTKQKDTDKIFESALSKFFIFGNPSLDKRMAVKTDMYEELVTKAEILAKQLILEFHIQHKTEASADTRLKIAELVALQRKIADTTDEEAESLTEFWTGELRKLLAADILPDPNELLKEIAERLHESRNVSINDNNDEINMELLRRMKQMSSSADLFPLDRAEHSVHNLAVSSHMNIINRMFSGEIKYSADVHPASFCYDRAFHMYTNYIDQGTAELIKLLHGAANATPVMNDTSDIADIHDPFENLADYDSIEEAEQDKLDMSQFFDYVMNNAVEQFGMNALDSVPDGITALALELEDTMEQIWKLITQHINLLYYHSWGSNTEVLDPAEQDEQLGIINIYAEQAKQLMKPAVTLEQLIELTPFSAYPTQMELLGLVTDMIRKSIADVKEPECPHDPPMAYAAVQLLPVMQELLSMRPL